MSRMETIMILSPELRETVWDMPHDSLWPWCHNVFTQMSRLIMSPVWWNRTPEFPTRCETSGGEHLFWARHLTINHTPSSSGKKLQGKWEKRQKGDASNLWRSPDGGGVSEFELTWAGMCPLSFPPFFFWSVLHRLMNRELVPAFSLLSLFFVLFSLSPDPSPPPLSWCNIIAPTVMCTHYPWSALHHRLLHWHGLASNIVKMSVDASYTGSLSIIRPNAKWDCVHQVIKDKGRTV